MARLTAGEWEQAERNFTCSEIVQLLLTDRAPAGIDPELYLNHGEMQTYLVQKAGNALSDDSGAVTMISDWVG